MDALDSRAEQPLEPGLAAEPFVERVMGALRAQERATPRWWPFKKIDPAAPQRPEDGAERLPQIGERSG